MDNKEITDMVTAIGCGIGVNFNIKGLRYEKIILLADADSDGHHITTLLLTFFYRHMPQLISDGRLYIAVPPLFRIDIGKETHWAADEDARAKILEEHTGRAIPEITRFKGLGEMMPKVLWNTTLNPDTRRMLKVEIDDHLETDRVISDLMGKDASARFRFIMERAEDAEGIDV
jgi:DNA gyrase subunit B/topoisomerase-4 subunit B